MTRLGRGLARALVPLVGSTVGCGYAPLREIAPPSSHIRVLAGATHAADSLALGETMQGARAALAAEGALGEGGADLVLAVARIDEASSGISDAKGAPLARGTELSFAARAIFRCPGDGPRDLGEVIIALPMAGQNTPAIDIWQRDGAVREAARQAGRELGLRAVHASAACPSSRAVAPRASQ